jgi:hypothetical protein
MELNEKIEEDILCQKILHPKGLHWNPPVVLPSGTKWENIFMYGTGESLMSFLSRDPLGFLKHFENDKEQVINCVKDSSDDVKKCINGFVDLGFLEQEATDLGVWYKPSSYFDKMLGFKPKEVA